MMLLHQSLAEEPQDIVLCGLGSVREACAGGISFYLETISDAFTCSAV